MAHRLIFRGRQVTQEVTENVAKSITKFGLIAEGYAKKELQKGHGVETGTLRRSIHIANPSYNWNADNVEPSSSTPEQGGVAYSPALEGNRLVLLLGSGLEYAMPVHQGHGSFGGYHYLVIGLERAYPQLPSCIREFNR